MAKSLVQTLSQHEEMALTVFENLECLDYPVDSSVSEAAAAGFLILEFLPESTTLSSITPNSDNVKKLLDVIQRLVVYCRHLLLAQRKSVDQLKSESIFEVL